MNPTAKAKASCDVLCGNLDPANTVSPFRRSKGHGSKRSRSRIVDSVFIYLALRALRRRATCHPNAIQRTRTEGAYRRWRARELKDQLDRHFDTRRIDGRNVLDFACGTGELSWILSGYNPQAVVGMDLSADAILQAAQPPSPTDDKSLQSSPADRVLTPSSAPNPSCIPSFLRAGKADRIPAHDESFDLICCFDALEHIKCIDRIASHWRRVLRPGGRVWIWWSSWRGPYGHHLDSLIPLPWVHLLFSQRTLFRVCAEIYDRPDFIPRKWDYDPLTKRKKPNKWRHTTSFSPFLNRLTRRRFEHVVTRSGLRIARRGVHGFGGSLASRATRILLPVPLLGDCVVSYYTYELVRDPDTSRQGS